MCIGLSSSSIQPFTFVMQTHYFRDPNSFVPTASAPEPRNSRNEKEKEEDFPYWDSYDIINQFYLELGERTK